MTLQYVPNILDQNRSISYQIKSGELFFTSFLKSRQQLINNIFSAHTLGIPEFGSQLVTVPPTNLSS